ncbi:hypothetical protein PMIN06_012807 [Paraphaeosphaeria minitans]
MPSESGSIPIKSTRQQPVRLSCHGVWFETADRTAAPKHGETAIADDECIFRFDEELLQRRSCIGPSASTAALNSTHFSCSGPPAVLYKARDEKQGVILKPCHSKVGKPDSTREN